MPESKDLDRIGLDKAIWMLRTDGNSCSVNTKALSKLTFSPNDFSVIRDGNGNPTGVFKVPANLRFDHRY